MSVRGRRIQHRNNSSKEAHARAAIKIVGGRNVAQMFSQSQYPAHSPFEISMAVSMKVCAIFSRSGKTKVSYIAINLFHDFVERRCLLCIFSDLLLRS